MRGKTISNNVIHKRALTKPNLLRMIRDFDIKNVNHLVYEKLRDAVKVKLENVFYKLDILLKYRKKKTIGINDVMFLLDDPSLFLNNFDLKKCKERENIDCLYFQKKPFRELIQRTMENTNTTYRMKKGVPVLIQYHVEYFLEKILNKSKSIVDNKCQKILLPRDITFPLFKY